MELFADWLVYAVFRLEPTSKLGAAVSFFIYDSVKILLLLFVMMISPVLGKELLTHNIVVNIDEDGDAKIVERFVISLEDNEIENF